VTPHKQLWTAFTDIGTLGTGILFVLVSTFYIFLLFGDMC